MLPSLLCMGCAQDFLSAEHIDNYQVGGGWEGAERGYSVEAYRVLPLLNGIVVLDKIC